VAKGSFVDITGIVSNGGTVAAGGTSPQGVLCGITVSVSEFASAVKASVPDMEAVSMTASVPRKRFDKDRAADSLSKTEFTNPELALKATVGETNPDLLPRSD
jgi:hypothetical protein